METQPGTVEIFRVYRHDTAVITIQNTAHSLFQELPDAPNEFTSAGGETGYTDFDNKIMAVQHAKSGALAYINQLIFEADCAVNKLKQYRFDHYEDLNCNLLDAAISRLERDLANK